MGIKTFKITPALLRHGEMYTTANTKMVTTKCRHYYWHVVLMALPLHKFDLAPCVQ